jgi:hypothetical protein
VPFPQLLHRSAVPVDPDVPIGRRRAQLRDAVVIFVILLGIVDSVVLGYHLAKKPGVFWARVQVAMVSPQLDKSNGLQYISPAMIVMAGVVAKTIDPDPHPRLATAEATLVGEGIRDGYSVTVPNTGGQWANQFVSPYLDVQAVAASPDQVTATTNRLIAEINRDLQALQDKTAVPARYRITTSLSPPAPLPIYYSKGSAKRAGLVTVALGIGISFVVGGLVRRGFASASRRRVRARAKAPALA